jgi:alpha-beta hydrolase superfamily lysophospholipase
MLRPHQRETSIAVAGNVRLIARIEAPPQPRGCIVISHGFGEHCGRYNKLIHTLTAIGMTTLRYDLRGHGNSGGKRGHAPNYDTYLDDLGHVIELARDVSPGLPTFLFGHSMGGGLVLNYALRRGGSIAGVIASGPWLRLAFQPPWWKVLLAQLIAGVMPSVSMPTNLDITKLSHDPDVAKSVAQDGLTNPVISAAAFLALVKAGKYALAHAGAMRLPLLLMHGGDDFVTDIRASEAFFAAASVTDKTFKRWDGMYHETLNEIGSEPVYQSIVDWLKPRLAPPG